VKDFHKGSKLYFKEITPVFLAKFETYLRVEYKNKINTIHNSLKLIRNVFNYAIRQDYIEHGINPFKKYKLKMEKTTKTYLSEDELSAIVRLQLTPETRMDLHRDMFIFAANAGGLRVSDVLMLKWSNFDQTHINFKRKKTGPQSGIKLPTIALVIIEKYRAQAQSAKYIFPMLVNDLNEKDARELDSAISSASAYINKNLKFIARKAGIEKTLSFHISRHTWATLYAISKLSWIKKQQKKIRSQERESKRLFISKETHYFQGRKYMLKIVPLEGAPKITLNKTTIVMHISDDSTTEKRQEVMNEWYREQLKDMVVEMIATWENKIGVTATAWRIRSMKTKWGSCNTDNKSILLNLELAKKPLHCIEYIVVHELIHIIERKHNDHFISLLNHHLPNWRHYKEELNNLPVSHPRWEY